MSSFKEKSQGFIIGIMVGLIVAGGFFVFKLDDYFKELNFYKSVSNSLSSQSKTEEPVLEETAAVDKKQKNKKNKLTKVDNDQSETGSRVEQNSDTTKIHKDSLTLENPVTDGIVVRKDELLFTKTIEVINLDPVAKMNGKDSLLQKVSGIKDDRSSSKQFLNLEFWSSPLNYKGYKMSKYKLVLYAIASSDGLKLFKLDDITYLKSSSFVYRLDPFGDFKPYERITDENIINKLK